jgi:hypothetical protein
VGKGTGSTQGTGRMRASGAMIWLQDPELPSGAPRSSPAVVISLPTPHSPAQVSVRARATDSSRKRVLGAMNPILMVQEQRLWAAPRGLYYLKRRNC